ncbi:MAG: transposase [Actinobacteria bacterium]|nr:transposase [Actinomycetota bacterium]
MPASGNRISTPCTTQVIVSTERDGLYVLDEILGNTTELPTVEHTTDSHGHWATFALCDSTWCASSSRPRIARIFRALVSRVPAKPPAHSR